MFPQNLPERSPTFSPCSAVSVVNETPALLTTSEHNENLIKSKISVQGSLKKEAYMSTGATVPHDQSKQENLSQMTSVQDTPQQLAVQKLKKLCEIKSEKGTHEKNSQIVESSILTETNSKPIADEQVSLSKSSTRDGEVNGDKMMQCSDDNLVHPVVVVSQVPETPVVPSHSEQLEAEELNSKKHVADSPMEVHDHIEESDETQEPVMFMDSDCIVVSDAIIAHSEGICHSKNEHVELETENRNLNDTHSHSENTQNSDSILKSEVTIGISEVLERGISSKEPEKDRSDKPSGKKRKCFVLDDTEEFLDFGSYVEELEISNRLKVQKHDLKGLKETSTEEDVFLTTDADGAASGLDKNVDHDRNTDDGRICQTVENVVINVDTAASEPSVVVELESDSHAEFTDSSLNQSSQEKVGDGGDKNVGGGEYVANSMEKQYSYEQNSVRVIGESEAAEVDAKYVRECHPSQPCAGMKRTFSTPHKTNEHDLSGLLMSPNESISNTSYRICPDDIFNGDTEMPTVDASPLDIPCKLVEASDDVNGFRNKSVKSPEQKALNNITCEVNADDSELSDEDKLSEQDKYQNVCRTKTLRGFAKKNSPFRVCLNAVDNIHVPSDRKNSAASSMLTPQKYTSPIAKMVSFKSCKMTAVLVEDVDTGKKHLSSTPVGKRFKSPRNSGDSGLNKMEARSTPSRLNNSFQGNKCNPNLLKYSPNVMKYSPISAKQNNVQTIGKPLSRKLVPEIVEVGCNNALDEKEEMTDYLDGLPDTLSASSKLFESRKMAENKSDFSLKKPQGAPDLILKSPLKNGSLVYYIRDNENQNNEDAVGPAKCASDKSAEKESGATERHKTKEDLEGSFSSPEFTLDSSDNNSGDTREQNSERNSQQNRIDTKSGENMAKRDDVGGSTQKTYLRDNEREANVSDNSAKKLLSRFSADRDMFSTNLGSSPIEIRDDNDFGSDPVILESDIETEDENSDNDEGDNETDDENMTKTRTLKRVNRIDSDESGDIETDHRVEDRVVRNLTEENIHFSMMEDVHKVEDVERLIECNDSSIDGGRILVKS